MKLNNRTCHTELHVYRQLSVSLLSKSTCIELGLLEKGWPQTCAATAAASGVEQPPLQEPAAPPVPAGCNLAAVKEAIVAEFPSVFQDAPFRPMAGPPLRINLRRDAVPCQHYRARTVPLQWRDAVEAQLSSIVSKGVIEKVPVGESLTWCHRYPMVVVVPKKLSAEPRITVDLTGLNKYVEHRLETDAAQSKGLGMALWQQQPSREWQILQHCSRHVTPAQSRYSATELELLAVMWAVHKAHLYLACADFELVVDPRPLIPILKSKILGELHSPRLARLKEKLILKQLIAVWQVGIEHKIEDSFSRYPVDDPDVDDEQADVEATTHIHATLFQAQRDHTTDDRIVALLEDPISCISKQKRIRTLNTNSFSPQPSMASHPTIADSTASWDTSSPFVTTYGLPTRCSCMSRVAVPTRLWQEVHRELQSSHQGQDRTLRRSRQVVY